MVIYISKYFIILASLKLSTKKTISWSFNKQRRIENHCVVTLKYGWMGRVGGLVDLLGFGWRDRGWVPCIFPIFCSIFLLLLIVLSWLVHDGCCFCFSAELELVLILLKRIELRNLVGLHSSLRWFDRVYQGRFVLDSAEELSQRQVWRQSLKVHQCFGSFDSSLTTGLFVSLDCMIQLFFCCSLVFLPS